MGLHAQGKVTVTQSSAIDAVVNGKKSPQNDKRMSRGCLATEYLPGLRAHLSAYGSADEHHALVVASLARRFLDRDLRFFGSWRTVAGQLHPRWRDRR